jgi:hypothetical protein
MDDVMPEANAAAGEEGLACPLCDYSLRGLTTPRCPECGYSFDWDELRNQTKYHPYLFEHAVRRRVRSFFKTLWHGLWPWRFWQDVRPTHEVFESRLGVYWAAIMLLSVLAFASPAIHFAVRLCRERYYDANLTYATSPWYPEQAAAVGVLATVGALYVFWPWLTFAVLMIFRISMRRARIRPEHVERCVIYSFDAAGVLAPLVLLAAVAHGLLGGEPGQGLNGRDPFALMPVSEDARLTLIACVFGLVAFGGVRLAVAYRRYLRFPHAGWVVLATQVIVGLIAAIVLLWVEHLNFPAY